MESFKVNEKILGLYS